MKGRGGQRNFKNLTYFLIKKVNINKPEFICKRENIVDKGISIVTE